MRALGFALLCLLVLPTASAHATVKSDDGEWFITVGHLNEPTSTWQRSGLDLIIRAVGTDAQGNEIRVEHDEALNAHESLAATIIAPNGDEMDCVLEEQAGRANEHGVTNRYTCDDPYILSQAGQYTARLVGTIADSDVDGIYSISGELEDLHADTVFPKAPHLGPADMEARIDALEAKVADLEARLDQQSSAGGVENGIPGFPPLLAGIMLLAFVGWRRRH